MPRANRHFVPGQLWHITHRCHEKSFLLRFPRDSPISAISGSDLPNALILGSKVVM